MLRVDPKAQELAGLVNEEVLTRLETSPYCVSLVAEDGEILGCGGINLFWPNRGEAWCVVNRPLVKKYGLVMFYKARQFLKACQVRRIEAAISCSYSEGHKWIRCLGFQLEAERMKAYSPAGVDHSLYALVRS